MRITIEMTEAESRSTVIARDRGDDAAPRATALAEPALDGGPVPESLLLALEGQGDDTALPEPPPERDTRAGCPPDWLRDIIDGGAART